MYWFVVSNCCVYAHIGFLASRSQKNLFFRILANLFRPHLVRMSHIRVFELPRIIHCRRTTTIALYSLPCRTTMPRASRKAAPPTKEAASESHSSAGHKHKKSVPRHKGSKKKAEKESTKKNDKANGMRKSAPESSGGYQRLALLLQLRQVAR